MSMHALTAADRARSTSLCGEGIGVLAFNLITISDPGFLLMQAMAAAAEGGGQHQPVPAAELMATGLSDGTAAPLPLKLEPEELRAPKRRKTTTPMVRIQDLE